MSVPALRLASAKLPVTTEFITLSSPPRLGSISDPSLAVKSSSLPSELDAAVGPADTGVVAQPTLESMMDDVRLDDKVVTQKTA
jgi:hypothetical protein